jgi:Low psii accumulation1 / Rep27
MNPPSNSSSKSGRSNNGRPNNLSPERYERLMAEVKAPYRSLRQFVYVACGISGALGGFVFLTRLLAGRDLTETVPNLALQIGIVALMIGLFRWEQRASKKK